MSDEHREPEVTVGPFIRQVFPEHERAFRDAVAAAFADRCAAPDRPEPVVHAGLCAEHAAELHRD